MRNGILERKWESPNGLSKIGQIVLPWSTVKDVLTELHGGSSGGHLSVKNTNPGSRQEAILRDGAYRATSVQQVVAPDQESAPHTPVKCWGPFRKDSHRCSKTLPKQRDQGTRHFLIAMHYFTKWSEDYGSPDQEASTVVKVLVTNFFRHFGIPRELHSDQGSNVESRLLQYVFQSLGLS